MIDKSQHVRELCQKLKPILGPQADRIWLLYLAENEEGKQQIEEYVELLANQHLAGSLDEEKINPLPPDCHQVDGEYRIDPGRRDLAQDSGKPQRMILTPVLALALNPVV